MTDKERRCPHGVRWPHECRECEATLPSPYDFKSVDEYEVAVEEWEKQHGYR